MKTVKLTSFKKIKSFDKVSQQGKAYTSHLVEIGYEGTSRSGFVFESQLPQFFEGAEITIKESENEKDGKTYRNFELVTGAKIEKEKQNQLMENLIGKIKELEQRISVLEKPQDMEGVTLGRYQVENKPTINEINEGLPEDDLPF